MERRLEGKSGYVCALEEEKERGEESFHSPTHRREKEGSLAYHYSTHIVLLII